VWAGAGLGQPPGPVKAAAGWLTAAQD